MKIWEAILYGIIGGITEVLPISFGAHAVLLAGAFNLTSLNEGGGYYIRAGVTLGVMAAILLAFRNETFDVGRAGLQMLQGKRLRRGDHRSALRRRNLLLGLFAVIPMFLSLIYTGAAERIGRLPIVALLLGVNGLVIFLCCRNGEGRRTDRDLMLTDTLLIGGAELLSVFPGLSPIGTALCVGRASGLERSYNLRLGYQLLLYYSAGAFLYRVIRAAVLGSFSFLVLLGMLLAALLAAIFGYLAIQYLRYLVVKGKLQIFAYYCWEVAAILLILALINA